MIHQPNSIGIGIRNVKLYVVPRVETITIREGKVDGPNVVSMDVEGVIVEAKHSVDMRSG